MKYSDEQRIAKIVETTEKLSKYISDKSLTREMVLEDETIRWTITTPLYNIGEHAYNLSDEFKQSNPEIPWTKISGLRHRLVHDYENTSWNIICDIIFDVLPKFQQQLKNLKKSNL